MSRTPDYSLLELASVREGDSVATTLANSVRYAQHAEALGFKRFWLAEHHNMEGISSSATSVLVGHIAGKTGSIRVGSGGVMLPNHPPLVIAEQFGTLECLYPGRIDLGLGRAPGTDPVTARALRRDGLGAEQFPEDVARLQNLLGPLQPGQPVKAIPGAGTNVPIWLLGSSLFSAQLAAMLGLPYAFASHFAPDQLLDALHAYRIGFRPSEHLERPHAMVGVNVVAADTDAEARRLFSSQQMQSTDMMRGKRDPLAPPIDDIEQYWTALERPAVEHKLHFSFVGSAATVGRGLAALIEETEADEVITTVRIFEPNACLRSLEILADVRQLPAAGDASDSSA